MKSRSSSRRRSELKDKENSGPVEQPAEAKAADIEPETKDDVNDAASAAVEAKMSDSELEKRFNCSKCQIRLKDVKLLKLHYWKVHIGEAEVMQANRALQLSANNMNSTQERLMEESQKAADAKTQKGQSAILHFLKADSSTPNRKRKHRKSTTTTETDVSALRDGNSAKKRPAVASDGEETGDAVSSADAKSEASDEKHDQEQDSLEKKKLEEKLNNLTDEEIKCFNLSDDIDENKLAERAEALCQKSGSKVPKKLQELKTMKTVWACWYCHARRTSIMWPARIEKIAKDSSGKSKVYVKYYELNPSAANSFKMDPAKVEPFFKPVKEHFQFKELVTIHKPQRLEFFTCYTNALREFVQELDEREKNFTDSAIGTDAASSISDCALNQPAAKEKYSIMGKTYTIDQVKELAHKPFSDATLEINRQRIAQSEKLFEALNSKECQDYLIAIFTGESKCKRHETYLKADSTTRRTQLKFSSPGPLIVAHQESLAKMLEDLSSNHYKDKPMHLKNYEYDVLYPESVIWALQKVEELSYKKAETKYKMGFKRTEEEIIKSKCNEIVNRLQKEAHGDEMETNNSTLDNSMADQSELNASSAVKDKMPESSPDQDQPLEEPSPDQDQPMEPSADQNRPQESPVSSKEGTTEPDSSSPPAPAL